jgi:hypothetical protein
MGLIVPLGEWVLLDACRTAAGWPGRWKVAVNLSPVQFANYDRIEHLFYPLFYNYEYIICRSNLMEDSLACLHRLIPNDLIGKKSKQAITVTIYAFINIS